MADDESPAAAILIHATPSSRPLLHPYTQVQATSGRSVMGMAYDTVLQANTRNLVDESMSLDAHSLAPFPPPQMWWCLTILNWACKGGLKLGAMQEWPVCNSIHIHAWVSSCMCMYTVLGEELASISGNSFHRGNLER